MMGSLSECRVTSGFMCLIISGQQAPHKTDYEEMSGLKRYISFKTLQI